MNLNKDAIEALRILKEVCEARDIDFVLIGAAVLTVCAHRGVIAETSRLTRDVDAVVPSVSWEDYGRLLETLVGRGFRREPGAFEHRLFYETAEIDLIPFGLELIEDGELVWPGSGNHMSAEGLEEALRLAEPVDVVQGLRVRVVPLWLLVYLKMIACLDRPGEMSKHLDDIVWILGHYEDVSSAESRRFDVHEEGIDYETGGAFLVGRDIAEMMSPERLAPLCRFFDLLEDEVSPLGSGGVRAARHYVEEEHGTLLRAMLRGLGVP